MESVEFSAKLTHGHPWSSIDTETPRMRVRSLVWLTSFNQFWLTASATNICYGQMSAFRPSANRPKVAKRTRCLSCLELCVSKELGSLIAIVTRSAFAELRGTIERLDPQQRCTTTSTPTPPPVPGNVRRCFRQTDMEHQKGKWCILSSRTFVL